MVLSAAASLTSVCSYSTTWLARAVPEDGTVVTLEVDPHCVDVATENFTTAGIIHKVNIILGPAAETLETLENIFPTPTLFDLVFIDADKEQNAIHLKHAKRLVRKGGVIVRIGRADQCRLQNHRPFVYLDCRQRRSKWRGI